ncbi:PAS domain S-box protein [Salinigranum sp. GCM10025319]|uniref:PAS domain S-box protein n=1 Tax=Salinigranum sp. GCM10025319 TaxID=3252687 RepID=UPI00360B9714
MAALIDGLAPYPTVGEAVEREPSPSLSSGTGCTPDAEPASDGAHPFAVRTVETPAAAYTAAETGEIDCVVVVGANARTVAESVEKRTESRLPVVALTALDGRGRELCRRVRCLVEGRRAELALRSEQAFLNDALDALDDVFYVYDAEGRLIRWNRRLNDVFGLDDVELAGRRPESFFVEDDRDRVLDAAREALAGGDVVVEAEAETEVGRVRFELTGRRLADDDGRVVGFSGVARDVTSRRRTTERLTQENENLEAFGRVLTHDLRNSLGVAVGYLEQYREHDDPTELRRVARALDRISEIIDEVGRSSRGEPAERSVVSLSTIARAAWDAVETHDALLVVDASARVEAEPQRLQRLFENLVHNAVEHGGPSPTVHVGDLPDGFFVDDDGPGIPEPERDAVFRTGYTTSPTGTGYGLGIVRELAAMHGWRVDVTESDRGGARFEVHGVTIDPDENDTDWTGEPIARNDTTGAGEARETAGGREPAADDGDGEGQPT